MTVDEALELTKNAERYCISDTEHEANHLAVAALRFQIDYLKKSHPLWEDGKEFHLGDLTDDDLVFVYICCPACHNDNLSYGQPFCDCCEQSLDWNEDGG